MRHLTKELDAHLRNEVFSLWALPNEKYSETTVLHWLRYHWPSLLAVAENGPQSEFEEQLHAIYMDLSQQIEKLPHQEKTVITKLIEGVPVYGVGNLAWEMNMNSREMKRLLRSAYRRIAKGLE
jgi:hypothetical protein